MAQACHICRKQGKFVFGHWADEHNPDGSLKPGATAIELSQRQPFNANAVDIPANGNCNDFNNGNQQAPGQPNRQHKPGTAFDFTSFFLPTNTLHESNSSHGQISSFESIGPLVDDGAPYSAIVTTELNAIASRLICPFPNTEPKPHTLRAFDRWQYSSGQHASSTKSIIGSVEIFIRSDANQLVSIRHLLIQGSSQWVIGRNITSKCNLHHINRNAIQLPSSDPVDYISMQNDMLHAYIPLDQFLANPRLSPCPPPSTLVASSASARPTSSDWPSVRRIIDKVHKHVCGHATYSDNRPLLLRNGLWSELVQEYLVNIVKSCTTCRLLLPHRPIDASLWHLSIALLTTSSASIIFN